MNRLCAFSAFFLFCLSAKTQTNYVYKASKETPLSEAFQTLSETYNLSFAYPSELAEAINISPKNIAAQDLQDLMDDLLSGQPVDFQCVGPSSVLLRKESKKGMPPNLMLNGVVTDAETQEPLVSCAVYLNDMTRASMTDEAGRFKILLSSKDMGKTLIISYLGYGEAVVPITGDSFELDIQLNRESVQIDDVYIIHTVPFIGKGKAGMALLIYEKGIRKNQAAFLGGSDLLRNVQLLPGVSADNDASSEIKIRGSNAEATMLLLDKMPVYKAEHYYGIFTSIQPDFVEEVSLYRNTFPLRYSGSTAGLVTLTSHDFPDRTNGTVNISTLSGATALSARISDKIALNVGARTTLGNVDDYNIFNEDPSPTRNLVDQFSINREDFVATTPDFGFYDVNGKLMIKTGANSEFRLTVFRSHDDFSNVFNNTFKVRKMGKLDTFREDFSHNEKWSNTALGAQYFTKISELWNMEADLHYSGFRNSNVFAYTIAKNGALPAGPGSVAYDVENEISDSGINLYFQSNREDASAVGISLNKYETDLNRTDDNDQTEQKHNTASKITGFAGRSIKVPFGSIDLGGRITYYEHQHNSSIYVSPQVMVLLPVNTSGAFKASFGLNQQFLRQLEFENRVGQSISVFDLADGRDVAVGESFNYMAGYQFRKNDWGIDIEGFYKDINGVLELANLNPAISSESAVLAPDFKLLQGTGKSYGVDVMVYGQFNSYTSWIAYTLSKSTNSIKQIFRGDPYPGQNDRRHQLKWINNFSLGHLHLTANYIYSSGKPYLAFTSFDGNGRRDMLDPRLTYRYLPFYSRFDIGAGYDIQLGSVKAYVGVSVFNLTNRQNVKFIQQMYSVKREGHNQNEILTVIGNEGELLQRTLNLNFQLRF